MKLGIALSGGGIRGIAHAGVIKALEENNIKIDAIGGTSSGSMVALLYSIGYTPYEIYKLCTIYANQIVKLNSNVLRNEIKNYIFHKKIYSQGINDGDFISKIFNKIANKKGITNINEIKMPIVIPSLDIITKTKCVFSSVKSEYKNNISDIEVGKAVQASSSFPILFAPLKYKNKLLLDGGIIDNLPIKEVKKLGANKIIAVKFNSDKIDNNSNAIDITMKIADLMEEKVSKNNLQKADYIIEVPTDGTGLIDVSKIDYCFESGYKTTIKQIDKIKDKIC